MVTYEAIVWAEATILFDEFKEVMQGEKKAVIQVVDSYYYVSSIWEKNNVRYSGIHKMNGNGEILTGTGLNLDNFEWHNVMKKKDSINEALYGSQSERGLKRWGSEEIKMFKYSWFLNGVEIEVDEREKKKRKAFNEEDAEELGGLNKPQIKTKKNDKLELRITPEMTHRPSPFLQMETVLYVFVKETINLLCAQNCYACMSDGPSRDCQLHHMKAGGCLEPDVDLADKYVSAIREEMISYDHLARLFSTVSRSLNMYPVEADALAMATGWISDADVKFAIRFGEEDHPEEMEEFPNITMQDVVLPENYPLYLHVRELFYDLNFDDIQGQKVADYVDEMRMMKAAERAERAETSGVGEKEVKVEVEEISK